MVIAGVVVGVVGGTVDVVVLVTFTGTVVTGTVVTMVVGGVVTVVVGGDVLEVEVDVVVTGGVVDGVVVVAEGQNPTRAEPVPEPVAVQYAKAPPPLTMTASVRALTIIGIRTIFMMSFGAGGGPPKNLDGPPLICG